jgi:uncharacterized membrane protein YccC
VSEHLDGPLGIKVGTAVFGFAGGIISLAFIKNLTRGQAALAVFVGLVTSIALTPMIAGWIGPEHSGVENGIAFLIGLCAMSALPALQSSIPNQIRRKLGSVLGQSPEE